jgi:hypothetical protein
MYSEIEQLSQEIEQYKPQLESEEETIGYYDDSLAMLKNKEQKAREKLMRLKGAFQFSEYKFTKSDIAMLVSLAIAILMLVWIFSAVLLFPLVLSRIFHSYYPLLMYAVYALCIKIRKR